MTAVAKLLRGVGIWRWGSISPGSVRASGREGLGVAGKGGGRFSLEAERGREGEREQPCLSDQRGERERVKEISVRTKQFTCLMQRISPGCGQGLHRWYT